ncbi:MAG: HAD-IA family hydrolase [Bacteroidota bacterium]|nr:HAD-IA family hydrolase [Bacteroidota bacterium]
MIYPEVEPGVKGLIFDLDGTLADSIPVHIHCWEETCKTFNYKFPLDIMIKMTGMPTRRFAEYIKQDSGCSLSVDDIMHMKQAHFYKLAHTIKPVEKVAQFVKENFGKIPMSIGTGGGKRSSGLILEAIGMRDYFDVIVTADDVTRHKPEPDTFLKCAELMGIEPEACQVFEDGEKGMEAARTAGMVITDVRQYY